MRILKARLHKYKRLRLNLIDTFEINPTAPTQFILGSNGAGKSSLLVELSPLPPDKIDYDKGGSKLVILEHNGITFVVESTSEDGSWHHSFKRDGKELNEGGTITVQLGLCREHLGYTPEIHALLIGEVKFTTMSFSDRRKWFTLLANSNYDYAVGVYKRITERFNESRHALKRTKQNLGIESAKLLPPEDLNRLRNECSDLYTQVQRLSEIREPLMDQPSENYIYRSNEIARAMENDVVQVRAILKRLTKNLPKETETLKEALIQTQTELQGLHQKANQYFEDHQRVQRLWEGMQASQLQNAAQVQAQLDECQSIIEASTKACTMGLEQTANAETTIASCDKLLQWWPEVREGFHDNTERGWGRQFLADLTERIASRQITVNQLTQQIARSEQAVEHMETHQNEASVQCPECKHRFQPNFSALTLQDAKAKLSALRKQAAELIPVLEEELTLQKTVQTYFQHYSAVMQQLRNYPGLESFARWIASELILVQSPNQFTDLVHKFRTEAGHWGKIETAQRKKEEIQTLAKELLARDNSGLTVQADRERLEALIGECEFQKTEAQHKLNSLKSQLQTVTQLHQLKDKLLAGVQQVDDLHRDAATASRREIFAQMIRELHSQLAFKEQALMAAERQQSVIEHLESEVVELTEATADYKILQQELSPSEGLIAEGLLGFMRTMVDQMNQTCSMLFSYPLTILPCATEGDNLNLNYKFPIIVDKEPRPDVTKGSSGMREVFDLSFVIAAMKALGLGSYPLFLDEFGKTLDPVHKQATVALLTSVMELENFEQIFMISHDVVQYGALGRSEICVLHEANVILPPNTAFNKHVRIN